MFPSSSDLLSQCRILVLDDSPLMLELIKTCLRSFNVKDVVAIDDPAECMERLESGRYDALIIDWRLRESDGLDMVRQIRRTLSDPLRRIPIVLCTGYSEYDRVIEASEAGIHEMLCKPVTPKELYLKLTSALTSDRVFVETVDYVGPERRQTVRQKPLQYKLQETGTGIDSIVRDDGSDEIFL